MSLSAALSTVMTIKLLTVSPKDKLSFVKEIFDNNRIHHIPVVRYTNLIGMISKSDFQYFLRGVQRSEYDQILENSRLNVYLAEDIMTNELSVLSSNARIREALDIFLENMFHAIPIVDDDALVGILTTHDIIKAIAAS